MSRTIHTPAGPRMPEIPKSLTGNDDSDHFWVMIEGEDPTAPEDEQTFETKEEALEQIKKEEGYETKAESSKKDEPEATEKHFTWVWIGLKRREER